MWPVALRELIRPSRPRHIEQRCAREEALNCGTHGVGLLLAIAALWLVYRATVHAPAAVAVGCTIYAATLVLVYGSSSCYHACASPVWRPRLRTFDHICIYLLIAGTYTPFMLTWMRGPVGYSVLAVVWSLAALGIAMKLQHAARFDGISTVAYVAMGWTVLPVIGEMLHRCPLGATVWMLVGGLFYTGGVVFYRLDHHVKYFHAVWHLFVLAGSVSQFIAVWKYILPWKA